MALTPAVQYLRDLPTDPPVVRDAFWANGFFNKAGNVGLTSYKDTGAVAGDTDVSIYTGQSCNGLYMIWWSGPNRFSSIVFSVSSTPFGGARITIIEEAYFGGASLANLRATASGVDSQIVVTLTDRNGGLAAVSGVCFGPLVSLQMTLGSNGWAASNNTVRLPRVDVNGALNVPNLAAAPAGPILGQMYYDTSTNKHRGYNGAWNNFY
jgi:hypothetical protein